MKRCTKCRKVKPESAFCRLSKVSDKRFARCKLLCRGLRVPTSAQESEAGVEKAEGLSGSTRSACPKILADENSTTGLQCRSPSKTRWCSQAQVLRYLRSKENRSAPPQPQIPARHYLAVSATPSTSSRRTPKNRMNASTPVKHKTPNYRLVTRRVTSKTWSGATIIHLHSSWEAAPLRSTRKDLHTT